MSLRKAWPVRRAPTAVGLTGERRAANHHDVIAGVRDAVQAGIRDHLGEARCQIGNEIAVEVGPQQRHIVDIKVAQLDAEHRLGLRLDLCPGRNATVGGIVEQPAGCNRPAVRAELVLAQEHLVRGMRRIRLVLVDERSRGVLCLVGCRRQPRRRTVVGSSTRMPSAPGPSNWVARVSTMKASSGGTSSPLPRMPSGPGCAADRPAAAGRTPCRCRPW